MTVLSKLALGACVAPVAAKVYFEESFGEGWEKNWVKSEWKPEGEMAKLSTGSGKYFLDEADKGLMSTEDSKFLGASAAFPSFSNEGKDLHILYSAKYENDLECGGGYIKVGPKMEDQKKFGDPTEYNIMFGPDKCGYNSRTHLIFSYKGKNVLKKEDLPYHQDTFGVSTLYHLALLQNGTAVVKINGKEIGAYSLGEDWEMMPAAEIPDESDTKPEDWVEEEQMDDPEDKKPEDWVEVAEIPDPDAKQPEDWDEEEDGVWEAPMKANPDFKGEFTPKKITNPNFKGEWVQKKKANPDYDPSIASSLYSYKDFGFIGLDLWQVKSGSIFDNMLITDEAEKAEELTTKFAATLAKEEELKKVDDDAAAAAAPPEGEDGEGGMGGEGDDEEGGEDGEGEGSDQDLGEDTPDDEDL